MTSRKVVFLGTILTCGTLLATGRLCADTPTTSPASAAPAFDFFHHDDPGNSNSNNSDPSGSASVNGSAPTVSGAVSTSVNTNAGVNTSSSNSAASKSKTSGNNNRFGSHNTGRTSGSSGSTGSSGTSGSSGSTGSSGTSGSSGSTGSTGSSTGSSTGTGSSSSGSTTATPVAAPPIRSANTFVIGVYSQPIPNFPTFISQGINTFVQWETSNSPLEWWAGEATLQGASTIRIPSTQPDWEGWDAGYSPAGGIAWALSDEPDGNGVTPAALAATAAQYRAVQHGPTTLPIWLNVRGGSINGMQAPPSPIGQYLTSADWIAEDFYPVTGWGQPSLLLANGQILDQMAILAPGKPKMCFIECSNQQLSWVPNDVGVTPAQMRAEIWDAVIHGAYGIVYFPQQIGNGFSFDARPANIITEMIADNALLRNLNFEAGTRIPASPPFECCLRNYSGVPTYITLNTGTTDAALSTGQTVPAQNIVMTTANPFPPPIIPSTATTAATAATATQPAAAIRLAAKPAAKH